MTIKQKSSPALNARSMTSFTLTISFLIVCLSGVALYVSPQGRIAHWTGWSFLGLSREQWAAMHLSMSLLFLISSLSHLVFNWKTLVCYLKSRKGARSRRIPELVASVVICGFFFIGTLWLAPPISGIIGLRDTFRTAADDQMLPPPRWHAELASVEQFAAMVGLSTEQVASALKSEGFGVTTSTISMADLAEQHDTSPEQLFRAVVKHHPEVATRRPGGGRRGGREH
ncbi:MAG: DUF4405 domain-containing protein [Phycisphaerae bacterium]